MNMFKGIFLKKKNFGFTLIELLIVIAVIAILTSIVFVALNPLARFQDARNSARWTDVNAMLSALKLHQVDNGGLYYGDIQNLENDKYFMIGSGDNASAIVCSNPTVELEQYCIDLSFYSEERGYLPSVPIDPGSNETNEEYTGYYLMKDSNGSITVGSCYEEQGSASAVPQISVKR